MDPIYAPREDSKLLAEQVEKFAFGDVLDMGTGSGMQAVVAARKKETKKVLAVDINPLAIEEARKKIKNPKIKWEASDLFQNVKEKFDTIIFNPPYLPEDALVKDLALDGGKKGYEIIERFLKNVNNHLKPKGIILMVFSSLTKRRKVDEFIKKNNLEYELLAVKHIFFEEMYVYRIERR